MHTDKDASDFFQADTVAPAPAAAAGTPASLPPTTPTWKSRIKPVHVAGAAFLAALAWLFWPSAAERVGQGASTSSSADPAAERYADYIDTAPPAAGRASQAAAPAASPAAVTTTSASAPQDEASASPSTRDAEIAALTSQITELNAALQAERNKPAVCAPAPSSSPPEQRVRAKQAVPAQHAVRRQAPHPREALVGYHLNTVYREQAWVEQGGRTLVVERGSMIGPARVERIDAAARVVETTLGDIR